MVFPVGNSIWRLQFVHPMSDDLRRSDSSLTLGVTDNSIKMVFIADDLSERMTDKVLCHELTHVYSFENNYIIDIQTEEIVADFMSLFGRNIIRMADRIMSSLFRKVA